MAALEKKQTEKIARTPESLTIAELAKEFDLTTRAIRFYEDQGLLRPERRGTRRVYTLRDRVRLKLVLRGKRLGMSLAEIAEILDLYDADRSERSQLLKFLDSLAARRLALEQQREDIDAVLMEIESLGRECRRRLKVAKVAKLAKGNKTSEV